MTRNSARPTSNIHADDLCHGLKVLREQLHAGSTRPIEVHACVTSTQDAARAFIAQHGVKAQGAIFLADEQTHGRGRLGRRWLAPPGKCLLLTYVFILQAHDTKILEMLSLSAAGCVADALESVAKPTPLTVGIKWPNDLLVSGAKIAGLLLESVALGENHRAVMLGIGINVSVTADELPPELTSADRPVTSLTMLGCPAPRLYVLLQVVPRLDALNQQLQANALDPAWQKQMLASWRMRNVLLGQPVNVICDGVTYQGTVMDIDPLHGLILQLDTGALVHLPAATSTLQR